MLEVQNITGKKFFVNGEKYCRDLFGGPRPSTRPQEVGASGHVLANSPCIH
jgi:hypothetical protein